MPTLTATPMALPQRTEQEGDQDFELDIRISMLNPIEVVGPVFSGSRACTTNAIASCGSCESLCLCQSNEFNSCVCTESCNSCTCTCGGC